SPEAAEPCDSHCTLYRVCAPEPLDPFQHFEMASANFLGRRLEHVAAAECLARRGFTDYEGLAPRRRGWLFQEYLRQTPAARLNSVAVQQGNRSHDFRRADVQASRHAMLNGPFHVTQAMQTQRQPTRWQEKPWHGDFLAANHVFMMHARQIDCGSHTAMDFLHWLIVVLERPHAHAFAARLPFDFIPDLNAARCDRSGHDRTVALHDERAIDRHSEAFLARSFFDTTADFHNCGLQRRNALA